MDIRQKEALFRFRGKDFKLRCNFNVLMDVTEAHDGELPDIFDKASRLRVMREYLAAMINDYADEQGWDIHVTPKELGRELGADVAAMMSAVLGLVLGALYTESDAGEEADSKN